MAATLEETLMGLGKLTLDVRPDPDVLAELVFGRFVLLYHGERLIYGGPITQRPRRSRWGSSVVARAPDFMLGVGDDGPVIEDVEWLAGNNKLTNPSGDLGERFWRLTDDTAWSIEPTAGTSSGPAWTTGVPADTDVLQSDESLEAEPGQQWVMSFTARRDSTSTRGRLVAVVVFEGRFSLPNLAAAAGFDVDDAWQDVSEHLSDCDIVDGVAIIGPTTRKQLLANPSFESGLDNWSVDSGTWTDDTGAAFDGTHSARCDADGILQSDATTGGSVDAFAVFPDERWTIEGYITPAGVADGEAWVTADLFEDASTPISYTDSDHVTNEPSPIVWRRAAVELTIPKDLPSYALTVSLHVAGLTTDWWYFDLVTATRQNNNRAELRGQQSIVLQPGRSYTGSLTVEMDDGLTGGTLRIVGQFIATDDRPPLFVDLTTVQAAPGETHLVTFTVAPPSGYYRMIFRLIGVDVYGGSFRASSLRLVDADGATRTVTEATELDPVFFEQTEVTATAPDGTERVHVEIHAEEGADGWTVDDVALRRGGATGATAGDVVDVLLRNPIGGAYLLEPRSIHGSTPLPYDLRVRNLTSIAALIQLSRAVMAPAREWRSHPDNTLSWGLADEIFTRRDLLLRAGKDVEVLDEPEGSESAEESLQLIKLIAGPSSTVGHREGQTIEAAASASAGDKVDYYGRPWTRTRLMQDATVDSREFAEALVAYEAERNAEPRTTVPLRLADPRTLGPAFDVGDWLLVEATDAGLTDQANLRYVDGEASAPAEVRVLARKWTLGPDFRAVIRRPDGTTVDVSDAVEWNVATVVELTVGDPEVTFVSDPQGGAVGNQFLRFRSSTPR